jgi:hypothetical protein
LTPFSDANAQASPGPGITFINQDTSINVKSLSIYSRRQEKKCKNRTLKRGKTVLASPVDTGDLPPRRMHVFVRIDDRQIGAG